MSNSTLDQALGGEPAPEWTRRPNAKDDLRAKARDQHGQVSNIADVLPGKDSNLR